MEKDPCQGAIATKSPAQSGRGGGGGMALDGFVTEKEQSPNYWHTHHVQLRAWVYDKTATGLDTSHSFPFPHQHHPQRLSLVVCTGNQRWCNIYDPKFAFIQRRRSPHVNRTVKKEIPSASAAAC